MLTFSAVLAALGLAPKTLPQANETLTAARAQLDSVNALFTAAGLPLEQMLATGPDSLKAHLASLDKSADVTRLTAELEASKHAHAQSLVTIDQHVEAIEAFSGIFSAIGITGVNASTSATEAKAKFDAHVAKATTLALAQTGHPAAHVPAQSIDDITPVKTSDGVAAKAALAEYEQLIIADNTARSATSAKAKLDFYQKHHAAISRGLQLRRRG